MPGAEEETLHPSAGIWLIRDGCVLMLRRLAGAWAPPGGVVEDGETPVEGAVRETLEESGFAVAAEPAALHDFPWHGMGWHIHQFIARAPAGEVVLSDEHTGYKWFPLDEYLAWLSPPPSLQLPESSHLRLREMRLALDLASAWIAANPALSS